MNEFETRLRQKIRKELIAEKQAHRRQFIQDLEKIIKNNREEVLRNFISADKKRDVDIMECLAELKLRIQDKDLYNKFIALLTLACSVSLVALWMVSK